MLHTAPTCREASPCFDACRSSALDTNGILNSTGAASPVVNEAECQNLRNSIGQGKARNLWGMVAWGLLVIVQIAAYAVMFYGVLVMQISLLPYVFLVALTVLLWLGYDCIRDMRKDTSSATSQR